MRALSPSAWPRQQVAAGPAALCRYTLRIETSKHTSRHATAPHRKMPTTFQSVLISLGAACLHIRAGLLQSDLHALHAIGLPAAHAQQAAVLGNCDRIALNVLHAAPGKTQVLQLFRGWLRVSVEPAYKTNLGSSQQTATITVTLQAVSKHVHQDLTEEDAVSQHSLA